MEHDCSASEGAVDGCNSPLILIADDDMSASSAMAIALNESGYRTSNAADGEKALSSFRKLRPDLMILDVMMPKLDGFQVCKRIRAVDEETPILFLSAKGDIVDKRIGYEAGADDYLVKPFGGEELVLRVGALLRRARTKSQPAMSPVDLGDGWVASGDLRIDVRTGETTLREKPVDLTPKERRIMAALASHPGEVFSKNDLIQLAWGEEYLGTPVGIAVYIRHLREKIEDDPDNPRHILTVWRCGYRLGEACRGTCD